MEHCSGDIQETEQGLKLTDKSTVQQNTVGKVVQCSSDSNLDILTLKFLLKYECLYSYKSNKKISQTRLKKTQSAAKNPFFPTMFVQNLMVKSWSATQAFRYN